MATVTDLSAWDKDPRLFLFTSLTAGSSHIVTATSRIETILKANRIPFNYIDTATDETARKLWGRRAGKKKLPSLVKEGYVIADLDEVEEWNEFGELKENIGPLPAATAPGATSVHAVQTSLGSLRLNDTASQAAKPPAAPLASAASSNKSTAKAPAAEGPSKVATPLVNVLKAQKESEATATTSPAEPVSKKAVTEDAPSSVAGNKKQESEAIKDIAVPSAAGGKEDSSAAEEAPASAVGEITPTTSDASNDASKDASKDAAAPSVHSEAAVVSTDALLPLDSETAPSQDGSAGLTKHRGSSVSAASPEAIKEAEQKIVIPEDDGENDTVAAEK